MTYNRKIKVLISAYACEPNKGSEPGVGWNWAKQIAKFAEVWVVTRANNKDVIEKELRKNPDLNMHFVYVDLPKWMKFWKKGQRGFHLYYLLWQYVAYRRVIQMLPQVHFELAHHLTFGNIWLPTFMHLLPIPFICGPMGGCEKVPKAFWKDFTMRSRMRELIRDAIIHSLRFNIFFFNMCRKAKLIIAKTSDTAITIPYQNENKRKVIITTDVAANTYLFQATLKNYSKVKILAVGGLESWRGFHLLLNAFSVLVKKNYKSSLVILGNGWDKKRLIKICIENALLNKVLLAGQVTREKYLQYLKDSTIFVSPCLKEGGVTALFDALTLGLPVICLDVPGSTEMVTNECGIKIKPLNPEQTINDLADALLKLANEPELRKKMGEVGRRRVEEFYTWEKKGEFIKKVYEEVLNKKLSGDSGQESEDK